MNILLTNDDGYNKEGILILKEYLKEYGTVYMSAPKYPQSGKSAAFTYLNGLDVEKIDEYNYVVDGTPVDSVHDVFFEDDLTYIACNLNKFTEEYKYKIEDEKLQFLFKNVEIPLSKVLFNMENCGFKFGRWLGIVWMEKRSDSVESPSSFPVSWNTIVENDGNLTNILAIMSLS